MAKDRRRLQLAVVGAGRCGARVRGLAREVGAEVARAGAVLLTGGRGGVMAAASAGARAAGGLTVGILPGADAAASPPNPAVEVAVFTGIGQARNQVLVLSAAAVVAVGGGWGTLSEIALALKHGIPVVSLESWWPERPDGAAEPLLARAATPRRAVAAALGAARRRGSPQGAAAAARTGVAAGGRREPRATGERGTRTQTRRSEREEAG